MARRCLSLFTTITTIIITNTMLLRRWFLHRVLSSSHTSFHDHFTSRTSARFYRVSKYFPCFYISHTFQDVPFTIFLVWNSSSSPEYVVVIKLKCSFLWENMVFCGNETRAPKLVPTAKRRPVKKMLRRGRSLESRNNLQLLGSTVTCPGNV